MERLKVEKYFTVEDDFNEIIKANLPKVSRIQKIDTGWTNFVFCATQNKKDYYFRFPRNDFFANALVKECLFTKFIGDKITLKVPKLNLKYDKFRPYSIHKCIVGESMTACYASLSVRQKRNLARDISKLILELNAIDFKKYKTLYFQPVSEFLDNLSNVSQNNYDKTKHDYLRKLEESELVISHGDLNPGNLIIKNGKLVAVIDFAFGGVSTKINDLSRIIGRSPVDFKEFIIPEFEKVFKTKLDIESVKELENIWGYVEEKYVTYIKQNHPDIVLPTA